MLERTKVKDIFDKIPDTDQILYVVYPDFDYESDHYLEPLCDEVSDILVCHNLSANTFTLELKHPTFGIEKGITCKRFKELVKDYQEYYINTLYFVHNNFLFSDVQELDIECPTCNTCNTTEDCCMCPYKEQIFHEMLGTEKLQDFLKYYEYR